MSERGALLLKLLSIGHCRVTQSLFFKKYLIAKPDDDFDPLLMKMKLICIEKVLRLALSMHVLCAAPLMSLISRMVFVFNFEQLLLTFYIIRSYNNNDDHDHDHDHDNEK